MQLAFKFGEAAMTWPARAKKSVCKPKVVNDANKFNLVKNPRSYYRALSLVPNP